MNRASRFAVAVVALGAATAAAAYGYPKYAEWSGKREHRARLIALLRDPEAAQFQNEKFVTNSDGRALCGAVNARNAFGGYVGYRTFIVTADRVQLAPEPEGGKLDRQGQIDELQRQLDFLLALKRHCFTDAEIAAGEAKTTPAH